MRLPKLQQLKYLVALHDCGHFGQAAKQCFVSQSSLSSAIQALEELLDSQLIERDHKTFVFTAIGLDVVQKARLILEQSADLVAMASAEGNEFVGELNLGIIPTIAPFVLSPLIEKCSADFPDLQLFLREDNTQNCLRLLREGQLDMVLMATPYSLDEFVEKQVGIDPFYRVYYTKDNPSLNTNEPKDIYLLENEHCLTDHALQACNLTDSDAIYPFQASSLNTLLAMVNYHQGETYLPKLAVDAGILDNSHLSYQTMPENSYRNLSVVWRKTSNRRVFFTEISKSIEWVLANIPK